MAQIFPLRNVRGPSTPTHCEICQEIIFPGDGYSVVADNHVDGYVCESCFAVESDPEYDSATLQYVN